MWRGSTSWVAHFVHGPAWQTLLLASSCFAAMPRHAGVTSVWLLTPCREAQDRTKQGHNRGKIVLKIAE